MNASCAVFATCESSWGMPSGCHDGFGRRCEVGRAAVSLNLTAQANVPELSINRVVNSTGRAVVMS
jgi:hypothetical protein